RLEHPASDDHVERGPLEVPVSGECDPLAVDECDTRPTDRSAERQAGQLGGRRGRVDGQHVIRMVRIEGEHGNDDLYLVAQPFYEGRAQRPVDEPAGEDGLLARTSLAPKERARYPTSGIHSLLDVDG